MSNNKEYKTLTRIYVDMLYRVKKKLILTQVIAIILAIALAAVILFVGPVIAQAQQPEPLSISAPSERREAYYDGPYTNQAAGKKHSRYKNVQRTAGSD